MLDFAHAEFHRAVHRAADLPPDTGAEVAFAGRSNAGKSAAINALARRRGLAAVSRTPGRTRSIHFYRLDARRYLVDLPGYGYAAVPERERRRWDELISAYLLRRSALRGLVLLCDARRGLTDLDRRLLEWFAPRRLPLHVLVAKADKLSRLEAARALESVSGALESVAVEASAQLFSATARTGVEEAAARIAAWLR
jgi:GTP-binding protein